MQVATVLGYDEIVMFLIENGADPNLRTKNKGYPATHLAVFANKPELLMELLTKTQADPMCEDAQSRTLLDLVYQYIPSYLEPLQNLLETLNENRLNSGGMVIEQPPNPDEDRSITGV
jgi:ankyrin repeat protein